MLSVGFDTHSQRISSPAIRQQEAVRAGRSYLLEVAHPRVLPRRDNNTARWLRYHQPCLAALASGASTHLGHPHSLCSGHIAPQSSKEPVLLVKSHIRVRSCVYGPVPITGSCCTPLAGSELTLPHPAHLSTTKWSEWQESNLHNLAPKASDQPLTHTPLVFK